MFNFIKNVWRQYKSSAEPISGPIYPVDVQISLDFKNATPNHFEIDRIDIPVLFNLKTSGRKFYIGEKGPEFTEHEYQVVNIFHSRAKYIRYISFPYSTNDNIKLVVPTLLPTPQEFQRIINDMQILCNQISWELNGRQQSLDNLKAGNV